MIDILYKTVEIVVNRMVLRALPPGTRRKRKDGLYEKQSNGKWIKVKEKKPEKKEIIHNIPDNVNPKTKKQVIEAYDKIKNDYTDLINDVKINMNIKGITGGEYNSTKKEIEISNYLSAKNPEVFNDKTSLVANAYDLVIHELGHAIHNKIRDSLNEEQKIKLGNSLMKLRESKDFPSEFSKRSLSEIFSEGFLEIYKQPDRKKRSKASLFIEDYIDKFRNKI